MLVSPGPRPGNCPEVAPPPVSLSTGPTLAHESGPANDWGDNWWRLFVTAVLVSPVPRSRRWARPTNPVPLLLTESNRARRRSPFPLERQSIPTEIHPIGRGSTGNVYPNGKPLVVTSKSAGERSGREHSTPLVVVRLESGDVMTRLAASILVYSGYIEG